MPIEDAGIKIIPLKLQKDSAKIEVLRESDGSPIFTGYLYVGERVNVDVEGKSYSIYLDKIGDAGIDRFINPEAAYFKFRSCMVC